MSAVGGLPEFLAIGFLGMAGQNGFKLAWNVQNSYDALSFSQNVLLPI